MHSELRAQIAFRLTGLRAGTPSPAGRVVPALAARHRDLTALRYDFPLVLPAEASADEFALPLGTLVERWLAADARREPLRPTLLRLEREVRALAAGGADGTLQRLWEAAANRLAARADAAGAEKLAHAREAIAIDGTVLDCDADFPRHFVLAAWKAVQKRKAAGFHDAAERLIVRLGEVLAADEAHSSESRSPERLAQGVGSLHREVFDFEAMSRVLGRGEGKRPLAHARRRRIRVHLAALESQRFFLGDAGYTFVFDRCAAALKAFRARHTRLCALARGMAMATLEAQCEYDESRHDPIFRQLRESPLTREEMARFPDYLVCLREADLDGAGLAELSELLSSGIPVKVLVQTDDLLEQSAVSEGLAAVGARAHALAGLAMGLDDVFVLQAAASHLPRLQGELLRGLAYPGPALFSIFSGATGASASLPPYLNAAAAAESRAFPVFTFDPAKGEREPRISLAGNPQPERDWPQHRFDYEDGQHQRAREDLTFTLADFLAADERFARHFLEAPAAADASFALADWLDRETSADDDAVPTVAVVDPADTLRRLIADEPIVDLARRGRDRWRALQRLAAITAPSAKAPPEPQVEPAQPAPAQPAVVPAAAPGAQAPAAAPSPATAAPAAAEPAKAPSSDEAFIETPRCTSCDECTHLNNRMFAYDANKQAYIADITAGTFRELVEAAESCQVSIIHPGKPRNADEPGLEELVERAKPFM